MMNVIRARRENKQATIDLVQTIRGPDEECEIKDWHKIAATGGVVAVIVAAFRHIG